jgi:hypothetical protein
MSAFVQPKGALDQRIARNAHDLDQSRLWSCHEISQQFPPAAGAQQVFETRLCLDFLPQFVNCRDKLALDVKKIGKREGKERREREKEKREGEVPGLVVLGAENGRRMHGRDHVGSEI